MLTGIAVQLGELAHHVYTQSYTSPERPASLVFYSILGIEYMYRYHIDRPFRGKANGVRGQGRQLRSLSIGVKRLIGGMAFSILCLIIRYV